MILNNDDYVVKTKRSRKTLNDKYHKGDRASIFMIKYDSIGSGFVKLGNLYFDSVTAGKRFKLKAIWLDENNQEIISDSDIDKYFNKFLEKVEDFDLQTLIYQKIGKVGFFSLSHEQLIELIEHNFYLIPKKGRRK